MKKIIVEYGPLISNGLPEGLTHFIVSCHRKLLALRSDIDWLFVVDKVLIDSNIVEGIPSQYLQPISSMPNLIGWKVWYDYQLSNLAKKNQADLMISTSGISTASKATQIAWMPAIPLDTQNSINKSYYNLYRKRLVKTLKHSQSILTCSEVWKQRLVHQHHYLSKNIEVLRNAPEESYGPLSWAEKESIKVGYAAGKEYFLVLVNEQEQKLVDILKSFSLFKKRQQSNLQMVFAGNGLEADQVFLEKLETFKYRTDVHLFSKLGRDEIIKLISAAYAIIDPSMEDEVGAQVLNAFKANVPVIVAEKSLVGEVAANAALFAAMGEPEALANQLMSLYKDEKLRKKLIEKGEAQWKLFDLDETLEKLMKRIDAAA